jgi:hypothetical protein
MKTLGSLFLVLMLCLVVVGFFRGWYSFSGHGREAESNKVEVKLTLDPDRVKEDADKVKEKTTELGNQAKDKVKSTDR